ncbi:MAG: CinA family protein [Lachnospiraceae bacterium]|nr:CinA family protein [Lachnospiraceae bacterium]
MDGLVREHYRDLTKALIQKGLTISTMESCTAGQIASLITDTEGASAVFKGGFVTYNNQAKIQQGVDRKVIEQYSVYSKETAMEMAKACRDTYETDYGIGVTGTLGNCDPNNQEDSRTGEVYFAIATKNGIKGFSAVVPKKESRLEYKLCVADGIYEKLKELMK